MNWSSWPASEGMFCICEMPFSPWQPTQSSAFSLPAATSAARAGTAPNTSAAQTASQTKRRGILIPVQTREAAAAPASNRSLQWFHSLFAVADAIDRTGPIVGDEDRAVL